MMKKLLLAAALALLPSLAAAQCNGVFGANTVCGSVSGGIPGQVSLGTFGIGTSTINADTIAALRALAPNAAPSIQARGYYAVGDGGGGLFVWNASSSASDNGGSIIIPNSAPANGRWIRQTDKLNTFTPEMFGAKHDGSNDDSVQIRSLMTYLNSIGGGTIELSPNTTYLGSSISGDGRSVIQLLSNVNIVGAGRGSTIKLGSGAQFLANGVTISNSFFPWALYTTGTANNVTYKDFDIDMNGTNNSCGGTCWHSNAALGIATGTKINVYNVFYKNNPGSNNTVFGTNALTPTVTDLVIANTIHDHYGDTVNAAATDFSADFVVATNATLVGNVYSDGPRVNGGAVELHGFGVTMVNATVVDHFNCVILGNLAGGALNASDITVINSKCSNVKAGIQAYSFATGQLTNINIAGNEINFLSGSSATGIDACSNISATTGTTTNLTVANNIVRSDVVTNNGNETSGICVGRWLSAKVNDNQTFNTQAAGVRFNAQVANASLSAVGNHIHFPGRTSTVANQVGVLVDSTAVTVDNINIQSNLVSGTVTYAVSGAQNSTGGYIIGNFAADASIDQMNWTGTGSVAIAKFAAGTYTVVGDSLSQTLVNKIIAGGTTSSSQLVLESTTGAGTTDSIVMKTASQVERFRIATDGKTNVGPSTAAADSLLTVNGNTGVTVAPSNTPQLHIVGPDAASAGLAINGFGAPARMEMYQANGTLASKTASGAGTSIFSFNGYGWDTTTYALSAAFQFVPTQTWTGAAHGTNILFLTTPSNSTSIATAVTFNASGGISVGTSADPGINNSSQANAWVSGAVIAKGSSPTLTTGTCSGSSPTGGATAGKFTAPACAAGTIILSGLPTAPNGYTCDAQDQTTTSNTLKQSANTTTSVTFLSTTTNADVIVWKCMGW